jgi:birA, biotin-[acetyl-CoA-carboxylase] ligase region
MSIDVKLIQKDLQTDFMGRKILILDKTDSTNLEVKAAATNKAENGTLIIAEDQRKGKGQIGKSWFSSKEESIAMSLLLYTDGIKDENLPIIPLAVGLGVSEALQNISEQEFQLKWPNDILLAGKKLCGILCEKFVIEERKYVAIGIGINVNNRIFPEELKDIAVSLFIAEGKPFSREKIISRILNKVEKIYYKIYRNEIPEIIKTYKTKCISIGKEIKFMINGVKNTGGIMDISNQGGIIVLGKNGNKVTLNSSQSIITK